MPSWPAVSGRETARRKPSCSGGSPRRVRLYGLRHLREPAAADDPVQDVLFMTFDSLRAGKLREDERLASYVLGTCRRMAIGLARSATRRQRLLERFGRALGIVSAGSTPSGCPPFQTVFSANLRQGDRSLLESAGA